jgi:hypothetical protein
MRTMLSVTLLAVLVGFLVPGCDRTTDPTANTDPGVGEMTDGSEISSVGKLPAGYDRAPSGLVTVQFAGKSLVMWPFSGSDLSGEPSDPVNLIFVGKADPLDIRAALLSLDGDRSGLPFPAVPPFTCKWQDAIGDVQTAYADKSGWVGSAIQLECGDHSTIRFHLRLFKCGQWTLGGAHFEALIPGTADHQVLSWELAEQLVLADLARSGLLDQAVPMAPTGPVNPSPFRTIPAVVYNGLPVELRMLIGGPLGDVTEDVPISTDGNAMILNLAGKAARKPGVWVQDFVLNYGQTVPKPFCSSGPTDYVYIQGPVHMFQTVRLNARGVYTSCFAADGDLTVTPVNPFTGEQGTTLAAVVRQRQGATVSGSFQSAWMAVYQKLGTMSDPEGGLLVKLLRVSSGCGDAAYANTWCGAGYAPAAGSEEEIVTNVEQDMNASVAR